MTDGKEAWSSRLQCIIETTSKKGYCALPINDYHKLVSYLYYIEKNNTTFANTIDNEARDKLWCRAAIEVLNIAEFSKLFAKMNELRDD